MIKPLFQKIVVAINGSEQSLHAAMYAILLAKQYKCSLKAVYVVDTAALKFLSMSKFFLKTESQKYEENLLNDGKKYLEQVVTFAKIKGVKVETELRKGSPWSEILHVADDFGADLILLGGKEHSASSLSSEVARDRASSTNMDIIGSARCNVPALLLGLWAQSAVKSRFSKYDKILTKKGITGAQAAAILLKANGITDVKIARINGSLTDNYNPTDKVLSLSEATYSSASVAAVGVAAHETGHAIQHNTGYFPLAFRRLLVPVANLGSTLGPVLAVAGLGFGYSAQVESYLPFFQMITNIGLLLFACATLFYIVTLPVEFNASWRALKILKGAGVFTDKEELSGAREVLWAAAMTYVASALGAIGNFVRLLLLTQKRRRR